MMDFSNNLSHSEAITSLTNGAPFLPAPTGSGANQHFIPRFAGPNQVSCFYEQNEQLDQQARNETTFCQQLNYNVESSDSKVNNEPRDLPRCSNSTERINYYATASHQQMEYKETTASTASQLNYQQEDSRYFQYHHQQIVQAEHNQHAMYSQVNQRSSHWQHQAITEHSSPCNQFNHYTPGYYEQSQHYQEDIQDKLIYYHNQQQQQHQQQTHHHHHQQQQQQGRYYIEHYSYPNPDFYSLNGTTQEVSEYHQTREQTAVDYPNASYYQTETIAQKGCKSTSETGDICFPSSSSTSEPQTISTVPSLTQTQSKQTTYETQEENSTWKKLLHQPEVDQHQLLRTKQLKKKVTIKSQSSDQVNSNSNSNSNSNQRNNQCEVCGRNYARPSTLKTHLRTHTNERPFKCNVCLKTFSQAANLTAHQRVHTGERPFSCPICGRQFSQSSSVITHLRTHSGERPYRCNMCSRTFSDSSTLTKHCRIHSGEKPYQCDYCPLNFSQSGNLSRHLKLHLISSTTSSTSSSSTSSLCSNNTSNSNNNNIINTNSSQLNAYEMPSDSIKGDATSLRKSNYSSQYC